MGAFPGHIFRRVGEPVNLPPQTPPTSPPESETLNGLGGELHWYNDKGCPCVGNSCMDCGDAGWGGGPSVGDKGRGGGGDTGCFSSATARDGYACTTDDGGKSYACCPTKKIVKQRPRMGTGPMTPAPAAVNPSVFMAATAGLGANAPGYPNRIYRTDCLPFDQIWNDETQQFSCRADAKKRNGW
jgi:hypothetical protein